ncbi:hypothetical protein B0H10DRAFT_481318 [Mycena sp. CBHHK59/15]|nr:hypothetical protein B0H10DRAFT_481318 [Mycena sp. CBHHK59/15]
MGACTAVITEISYHIVAKLSFITEDQWRKELERLVEDVTDTTADPEEGPAEMSGISPAYQARDKIFQVYPQCVIIQGSRPALTGAGCEKWPPRTGI